MDKVIMWLLAISAMIGGLDRILGNRLGLGKQFERGFELMGSTALSMAGILCLVPLLSKFIREYLITFCAPFNLDPALFGGLLAIDMGGYQLAIELGENPQIANFAGIVIASILGCTICFTIPVGIGMLDVRAREDFTHGILLGLISIPAALLIGGTLCDMTLGQTLKSSVPFLLLALCVIFGLRFYPNGMIRCFGAFARLINIISTLALMFSAFQYMTGITLIEGLAPIEDSLAVVASIAVVMLGSLPFAEMLHRLLKRPLTRFARAAKINSVSATALLIGMVSVLPALSLFPDMDRHGRVISASFLVCAASSFAAHLAFTASVDTSQIPALLFSKLIGGAIGVFIALFATRKSDVNVNSIF